MVHLCWEALPCLRPMVADQYGLVVRRGQAGQRGLVVRRGPVVQHGRAGRHRGADQVLSGSDPSPCQRLALRKLPQPSGLFER